MSTDTAKKKVPVKEGLLKLPGGGEDGHLIGSKCNECGEYFHPMRMVCANCYSENMKEIALSKRGIISTFTIVRVGYPDRPVTAPFITAEVKLPENVTALSLVTDIDFDKVKIGTEVELYFWKTGEDDEGNDVMAYAFRPIPDKKGA